MSGDPRTPVVAVVAALNREDTVAATVRALASIPGVTDVVVVDDGSTDDTAREAARAGARVVRLEQNVGKGGAVAAGLQARPDAGTYLLVDADVGSSAAAAEPLLGPVVAGSAEMAVGVLPAAGARGGFGLVRRVAAAGIRRATGLEVLAPLSGQRAVEGRLLRSLDLAPRFGLEVGMTVDVARAGGRVVEIPVALDHRHTGRSARGFTHRGGQGLDAARALWPRLTSSRQRIAAMVALWIVLAASLWWGGARSRPAGAPLGGGVQKVLIVGAPGLSWDDVGTGRMPELDALVARGALGAMNVRTASAVPSTAEGYLSLGAGARVEAGPGVAGAVGRGPVVVPGAASFASGAGGLGRALAAAGRSAGVIGTADTAEGLSGVDDLAARSRPAAVAVMDGGGVVAVGNVEGDDLLMAAGRAPFGRRADPEAVVAATVAALSRADVVLVDAGDLDRAEALRLLAAPDSFVAGARASALVALDGLLGRLVDVVGPATLVLVVPARPPGDEWRLVPVVAAGAGVPAGTTLHSPSTARPGLVTLTDVAPTVLQVLGSPVPTTMVGRAFRAGEAGPGRDALARLDAESAYRERTYAGVGVTALALHAGAYAAVGALASSGRGRGLAAWRRFTRVPGPVRAALGGVLVALAAFPAATYLFRAARLAPALRGPGTALLWVALAVVAAVAAIARPRRWCRPLGPMAPMAPMAWVLGATVALIVADLATGARLQVGSLLGYSPQSASRYHGLGNSGFAVLAGAAILAVSLHVHHAPRRREAVVAAGLVLGLVCFAVGAPVLGADAGGLLALVPVAGAVVVALSGHRASRWATRRVAIVLAATTLGAVAAATAVDASRPPGERGHLGRLARDVGAGDLGSAVDALGRRAGTNLDLLAAHPEGWLVLAIAAGLALLLARGRLAGVLPPGSALRAGTGGALAVGVLGFVVNDSGAVVVALVLAEVGPLLALLAMSRLPWPGAARGGARPEHPGHPGHPADRALPGRPGR